MALRHKAIGIDLGTTNSVVAWVDRSGRTAVVPNAEGDILTPSVVLFDDSEVVVGKEARNATVANPERVAVWVKRDMGAPIYSRPIRGEYLPPEVIQACILRKLRADVVHALGPESRVVITVPADVDEPRRKATSDAGEMAGLKVLDIVNEPTAAALAFGEVLGYLSRDSAPRAPLTVLVYDLGGGTFDVTLLRLGPGAIRMLATDGDVQLGGYDWDLRLVKDVAEQFRNAYGVDPLQDGAAVNRLFNAVIEAKHTLSVRTRAPLRLEHGEHTLDLEVTRQRFEELTADLLERTAYTTRQLIAAAKLDWRSVNRVLLVGGSTRMPMVQRMLQQLTGIAPDHSVNPDEAVARGAALYAHYLLCKEAGPAAQPAFEVTNVNSHSLGVEGIDQNTLRKTNVILIPRNTPLPAKFTERFATKTEGQRSIVIQVLEGESTLPAECTAIGRMVVRDLPEGLPKGWPVEVTFEYETNSRLTVRAAVPGTHREVVLDMEREVGLSSEGVARWKRAVSSSAGFNAYEAMLLESLGPSAAALRSGEDLGAGGAQPAAAAVHAIVTPSPPAMPGPRPAAVPVPVAPRPMPPPFGAPLAPVAAGPIPVSAAPMAARPAPPPARPMPGPGPIPVAGPPVVGVPRAAPPGVVPAPSGATAAPGPAVPPPALGGSGPSAADVAYLAARRRRFRLMINVIGYSLTAAIGLTGGYLILSWLYPQRYPWPW